MDGISGAASILTLIQAAAVLVEGVREFTRRLRNAPQELHDLSAQLLIVQAELQEFRQLWDKGHSDLFTSELRKQFQDALVEARDAIAGIETICAQAHGNERLAEKLRWVRKDKDAVDFALARLRFAKERLVLLVRILSGRGASLTLTGIDDLKTSMSVIAKDVLSVMDDIKTAMTIAANQANNSPILQQWNTFQTCLSRDEERRRLASEPWFFGSSWAVFGMSESCIPTVQGAHTDCFLAMQLALPLVRIVGRYAFVMSISVRTFPLCRAKFRFLNGSTFALSRILPSDDPFMVACDKGNLIAIRTMLEKGEGRVSDITDRNWTPLAFAIRSGSADAVKELLKNGADVDGTLGVLQTTPLQWAVWHKQLDVTRLLLGEGASQDHINKLGWNITFFCWPKLQHGEQCMLDFLNLLAEDSYQDLDVADTEGWTALHRVAAFSLPSEVEALMKLGADPEKVALPLRWNAIHHAVFYGNYGAFKVLLPRYGDNVVSVTDERGWTLLHIAASAGHDDIVRHLLRLGADPTTESKPFMSHMPESLFKRACTSQEVAAAQSLEREQRYLEAVRDLGLSSCYADVDAAVDAGDELEFWEAQESFP